MTDQRNAASRQTETDFYYPLIIEQWNRRGVTNVEMARRLGKSVSLIGKVKSGRASFTAAMQIRVMEILEIDRQRAFLTAVWMKTPLAYFDDSFDKIYLVTCRFVEASCPQLLSLAEQVKGDGLAPEAIERVLQSILMNMLNSVPPPRTGAN